MSDVVLKINANKDFLDEVKKHFESEGTNMQESILSYLSWYIHRNDSESTFPFLIAVENQEIPHGVLEDLKTVESKSEDEFVVYTNPSYEIS